MVLWAPSGRASPQTSVSTCASTGQKVIDIPPGMTTTERVRWIAARLAKLGIATSTRTAS